jgi:arylsulfatase A-like enzyme
LIFRCPERLDPAEIKRPVSQVDLLPTVLTLAGLSGSIPAEVQGRDVFSAEPPVDLMAEFWDDIRKQFSRAYISGNLKLIRDPAGKSTLYDLGQDPRETNDVSFARPDIPADLSRRLEERLNSMPLRKFGQDERKKKEMEKLLKSLGYLDP